MQCTRAAAPASALLPRIEALGLPPSAHSAPCFKLSVRRPEEALVFARALCLRHRPGETRFERAPLHLHASAPLCTCTPSVACRRTQRRHQRAIRLLSCVHPPAVCSSPQTQQRHPTPLMSHSPSLLTDDDPAQPWVMLSLHLPAVAMCPSSSRLEALGKLLAECALGLWSRRVVAQVDVEQGLAQGGRGDGTNLHARPPGY